MICLVQRGSFHLIQGLQLTGKQRCINGRYALATGGNANVAIATTSISSGSTARHGNGRQRSFQEYNYWLCTFSDSFPSFRSDFRAQSQASKLAPSQRGTTDYQYFVSVWPLTELFDRVKSALEPINMRPPNKPAPATKMQLEVHPLNKGDIQKRDTKPGGDGVDIAFTTRDEQGQQLTGNVKILREFDSPLIEDLAPYWTKGGDVQVYTVKFTRRVGNPLQLRKLYQMVKVAMPPGLVSGS